MGTDMPFLVERIRRALRIGRGIAGGITRRPGRTFRPQQVSSLEGRALLTSLAAIPPRPSQHATSDDSATATPWAEIQNVPFPTVGGQSELLDVYTPTAPAPTGGYPVMIAIHGGGWRSRDKGEFGLRTANAFTPEGYVVVAPNYVLSKPGKPTWPENFEDVQASVQWVRSHASTLGVNPAEIVAEGESAGANLAALLGVYSTRTSGGEVSSAVDAVVAVSTPANLTTLYREKRYAGTAASQFLGGPPGLVHANYVAASPIDHVSPGDPPTFLVHGREDPIIPVSQSEQFKAALTAAGVSNQLVLVHGGHGLDFPAHYSYVVPDIVAFLNTTWKAQQT
jgi:acetyl esterase/lipase